MAEKMIELRNKKTGQVITVPRSKYIEESKGLAGIGEDIKSSAINLLPNIKEMAFALPEQLKQTGRQIVNDPSRAYANIGAGLGEGAVGTLNIPSNIMQYLARKGIVSQNAADETLRVPDTGFEKAIGLDDSQPGDQLLRMPGQFFLPAKAGKLAAGLGKGAQAATAGATFGVSQNQDPLQMAIMSVLGEHLARKGMQTIKGIPNAVNTAAGVEPPPPAPPGWPVSPAPTANMSAAMPAPMNANFAVPQPAALPPAVPPPTGISWNAKLPDSMSWIKNIPQAAKNTVAEIPQQLPKAAAKAGAMGLDLVSGGASKLPIVPKLADMGADYLRFKSMTPEEFAQEKLFSSIKPERLPKIEESLDAAKTLNLDYLTPAETIASPYEAAKQGTIGRTSEGSQRLEDAGFKRLDSEKNAVDKILSDIYNPDDLSHLKNQKYQSAMQSSVPDDFVQKYIKKPTVIAAIKKIASEPAYREMIEEETGKPLSDIPPNTFQYWDIVKRVMYDLEDAKTSKEGKPTQASDRYGKTRRDFVNEMDKINEDYKPARRIAERGYVRRKIERHFNTRERNIKEMAKYLKNADNEAELLQKLQDLPDVLKQLKAVKTLGKNLIPSTMSNAAAKALVKNAMSEARNPLDAKARQLEQKYGEAHDVATVDLMTHPEWINILRERLRNK
jgi:hypothetical protein